MVNFTWKFLQDLNRRKNSDAGFTLIELLVVIIIIGVLSAIALPSFLNQVNKGKEVEAVNFVDYLNTIQNTHYSAETKFKDQFDLFDFTPPGLEANTVDPGLLGLGLTHKTENYFYGVKEFDNGTIQGAVHAALSPNSGVKSYLGVVYIEDGVLNTRLCKAQTSQISLIFLQFVAGNLSQLESEYCN